MAGWLAEQAQAALELVYVFDAGALPALPREGAGADPVLRHEIYRLQGDRVRERARIGLEEIAAELPAVTLSAMVLDGLPAPVIRQLAVEDGADLLVCGTAARRGLEYVLRGSVVRDIAAGVPCPVVTVPRDAAIAETGPVIGVDDGSERARRALRHGAAIAERLRRELVPVEVGDENPVQEAVGAGRAHRACLLVAATRGPGPLRAELFGSLSTGLVQTAGRPVALVSDAAADPS
jgi:nucleotide-binding universal stress UspA family protein